MSEMKRAESMVERVARAICIAKGKDPDADWRIAGGIMRTVADFEPQMWRRYVKQAEAAIAALRDPTEAMMELAFETAMRASGEIAYEGPEMKELWQAMIDAALK